MHGDVYVSVWKTHVWMSKPCAPTKQWLHDGDVLDAGSLMILLRQTKKTSLVITSIGLRWIENSDIKILSE